jgi:hypothetical protein
MVKKLKIALVVALLILPVVTQKDYKFDTERKEFNEKIVEVKKKVSRLAPHLSEERQMRVAAAIESNSKKYDIPKKVLLSIIKIESNFRSNAVSPTGDYSIVQINLKIWDKEFARLGLSKIDRVKLINSDEYAIGKMCKILNIIKARSPRDPKWYARYHSNTPEFNEIYKLKIDKVMQTLASK